MLLAANEAKPLPEWGIGRFWDYKKTNWIKILVEDALMGSRMGKPSNNNRDILQIPHELVWLLDISGLFILFFLRGGYSNMHAQYISRF